MFFNAPGNQSKAKKAVYLFLTTVLGLFLSLIVHAAIEIGYISWALNRGRTVPFYGNCALPPVLQASLWISGGVGGFFLGRYWWRKIYVERVWARSR